LTPSLADSLRSFTTLTTIYNTLRQVMTDTYNTQQQLTTVAAVFPALQKVCES